MSRIYCVGKRLPVPEAVRLVNESEILFCPEDILHIELPLVMQETMRQQTLALLNRAREAGSLISVDADVFEKAWCEDEGLVVLRDRLLKGAVVFSSGEAVSHMGYPAGDEQRVLVQNDNVLLLYDERTGYVCKTLSSNIKGCEPAKCGIWTKLRSLFLGEFLMQLAAHADKMPWQEILRERSVLQPALYFAGLAANLAAEKEITELSDEVLRAELAKKQEAQGGYKAPDCNLMKKRAEADYYRMQYHMMPEYGWLNDPNGIVMFQGRYHAFFQYHPFAAEWGPMHWAHVVSDDLLHWSYLPIAIAPDQSYEMGCFSGNAVVSNGELVLVYTAHVDGGSPKETQCIAVSRDGIHFQKYEGNPVIWRAPEGFGEDFRDPNVTRVNGKWYMVVGATKNRLGSAVMYSSDDLRNWEYRGIACQSDGTLGDMWECPDLFWVDDVDVLMCSPMNMKGVKTMFLTGKMDYESCRFIGEKAYEVDYGYEFYAPKTFCDNRGRRILIGWMDIWGNEYPTYDSGWVGAMTLPRELFLRDGQICQKPIDEVIGLRKDKLYDGMVSLSEGVTGTLNGIKADCMEILLTAPAQKKGILSLRLRASEDFREKTVVAYDFAEELLIVDRHASGTGRKDRIEVSAPCADGKLDLRIFVDRSSIEIFACGGRYTISGRIYPNPASVCMEIVSVNGDLDLERLEIYRQ